MKKTIFAALLVVGLVFSLSSANAAMLGVELLLPDILSNQTGIYTYTWDSDVEEGLFTARATPLAITYDGNNVEPITGDAKYTASLYVDGSGNFLRGVGGSDLTITGDGETLLTGEITGFGWFDVPGSSIALFDFKFKVSGGSLADDFLQGLGGDIMIAEKSDFAGDWMIDHDGLKVKHDTASVVPIPGTVWLLGAGLIAMVGLKRKKKG